MHTNKNLVGSPHARRPPHRSSIYREQLAVLVRKLVEQADKLNPKEDREAINLLHIIVTELWPILDHEFPYMFGLGQALEEWLDLKLNPDDAQMAAHQRKIVVGDLDKYLAYTPEDFAKDLKERE